MYNVEGAQFLLKVVQQKAGMLLKGSVCELGNQHVWEHAMPVLGTASHVARDWFRGRGVERYVSIDLNGEDGALALDLREEIDPAAVADLGGPFKLVTNVGTSEHVEPREAQWDVFANVHRLCRPGGVMLHLLPPVGQWLDHCRARYDEAFFELLAERCGYAVLELTRVRHLTLNPRVESLAVSLGRTERPFAITREELTAAVAWDEPVMGTGR